MQRGFTFDIPTFILNKNSRFYDSSLWKTKNKILQTFSQNSAVIHKRHPTGGDHKHQACGHAIKQTKI